MPSDKPATSQLRLRVFAGPNGSGKSTVIRAIRETEVAGHSIDFGVYINADDIAVAIAGDRFSFETYEVSPTHDEFFQFADQSGLLNKKFGLSDLQAAVRFEGQQVKLQNSRDLDRVAQLLARFLREALLKAGLRFSFETVFSHESNLEIMERAAAAGYKVYLYFVSTESPEINKYRVALRKKQGGHDVPADKIESRYYASLGLLHRASQIAYQAFFFDNSLPESPFQLIGHFKKAEGVNNWDTQKSTDSRIWFEKYFLKPARENGETLPPVAD